MNKIAVLIPCYNEEQTIKKVIMDFQTAMPEAIVYVYDNNSTDHTADIAKATGAEVKFEYEQGKGNVIRRMFRAIDADCYVLVDGDDTYPVENALKMVNMVLNENVDMVIADRLSSTYFMENKRTFHNNGNKFVRWLINYLWGTNIKDIMTGYRAFSKSFVKLFPVMSEKFEIETEMTLHALDKRFTIKEISVQYKDRPEGSVSKLNTFSDGFKILKIIFVLFKEYRPLLFFGWFALALVLLSIGLFVPILIEFFETGLVPRFPTLFVSIFFALAAIQSFFTGLCLDVIVQKDRKMYELKRISFTK
ncbi:MAG: glycosyltransferase family 2 protein [Bacteroidales bacterium]|nr:glycosyltransferase family 2 protein [Bacteroidales bacterium]